MALDAIQASPDYAESSFRFLTALGFELRDRWVSGGQSFRDGWRLSYSSPLVDVVVVYLDTELDLRFTRSGISADYWKIDRLLFARRSGFHGNMFPPGKLATAIDRVSEDIRKNYGPVLACDDATWSRIASCLDTVEAKGHLP